MKPEQGNAVVPFVGVMERDAKRRPVVFTVPARAGFDGATRSAGRYAVVRINDATPGALTFTCTAHPIHGDGEGMPCLAVGKGTICYHCLAALFAKAEEARGVVWVYETWEKAKADTHASNPPDGHLRGEVREMIASGRTGGYAVYFPPVTASVVSDKDAEIQRLQAELAAARGVKPVATVATLPVSTAAFLAGLGSADAGDPPARPCGVMPPTNERRKEADAVQPLPVTLERKTRKKKA